MNRIAAIRMPSRFAEEPHLVITVDGVPLDELLDAAPPGLRLAGPIPSLLGWFHDEADRDVPWGRILPEVGCTGYAPLLICGDDLDYVCTVVMAEVVAEADAIRWDRLGLSVTRRGPVGSCIRWEPGLGSYRFDRAEYEAMLAEFRAGYEAYSSAPRPAPEPPAESVSAAGHPLWDREIDGDLPRSVVRDGL